MAYYSLSGESVRDAVANLFETLFDVESGLTHGASASFANRLALVNFGDQAVEAAPIYYRAQLGKMVDGLQAGNHLGASGGVREFGIRFTATGAKESKDYYVRVSIFQSATREHRVVIHSDSPDASWDLIELSDYFQRDGVPVVVVSGHLNDIGRDIPDGKTMKWADDEESIAVNRSNLLATAEKRKQVLVNSVPVGMSEDSHQAELTFLDEFSQTVGTKPPADWPSLAQLLAHYDTHRGQVASALAKEILQSGADPAYHLQVHDLAG